MPESQKPKRSPLMFVVVKREDHSSHAVVARAIETHGFDFAKEDCILLTIIEVEGCAKAYVTAAYNSVLPVIEGVEQEAETLAAETVFNDKDSMPQGDTYFCTIAEYIPQANKCARIIAGVLYPNELRAN